MLTSIRFLVKICWLLGAFLLSGIVPSLYIYTSSASTKQMVSPLVKNIDILLDQPTSTVAFIENVGQWNEAVHFQAEISQGTLFVTDDALWLSTVEIPDLTACQQEPPQEVREPNTTCIKRGVNLRLEFVGATSAARITGVDQQQSAISYFMGNDKDRWHPTVPIWNAIRYQDLYPGLDLVVGSDGTDTSFQWIVTDRAQARLEQVALRVVGADGLVVDDTTLQMQTTLGAIRLPLFTVVTSDGTPLATVPSPQISGMTLVAPFRTSTAAAATTGLPTAEPLPSNLFASTFLGGSQDEFGKDIARDGQGNIYVFGETISLDFPTTPGAWQTTSPSDPPYRKLYISQFSPDLSRLLHSTYLGGAGDQYAETLLLDSAGNVYVAGYHFSNDFPTTETTWPVDYSVSTAYVAKLSPLLDALTYSVMLGGSDYDAAYDIALDHNGAVYVTGQTRSPDFLVTEGAYDTVLNSPSEPSDYADGFVTKIRPDGSGVEYSTFLGGRYPDMMYGIAIDQTGHAYVTGVAQSDDYPITPGAFQSTRSVGFEGVVTKLSPTGTALVYSSYLGGSGIFDEPAKIVVDHQGFAYVVGATESADFPITPGAYDTLCGDNGNCGNPDTGMPEADGFLTKFNQDGSALVYSTYFGQRGDDDARALTIDADGNAYVLAHLPYPNFPMTPGAYSHDIYTSGNTAFLKFNATGTALLRGTYFFLSGRGMVVADNDVVYSTGRTRQPNFPTTPNAYDRTCGTDGTCNEVTAPGEEIIYADATVSGMALPAAAITITLGIEGGTLAGGEDQIGYTFSANTFTDTVVFTHAPRHPLSMPPVVALSHVNRAFANYAVLSDTGTLISPTQPYSLSITYDEADLSTDESTLALYFWDGAAWVQESTGVLDTSINTITATPNRVGWWAVLGDARRLFLPLVHRE